MGVSMKPGDAWRPAEADRPFRRRLVPDVLVRVDPLDAPVPGGRHSLQIEINRRLYMDERKVEKTAQFGRLKADIDRLVAAIAGFVRENCARREPHRKSSARRDRG